MDARLQDPESYTLQSATKLGSRDRSTGEDSDGTLASVALCIEQLRQSSLSSSDKESVLSQLLDLISSQKSAFSAVGSHSQVVPVLVSLLRSGSFGVKTRAAGVLSYLCKENDLRVKVLLGGCIPPLLGLLQSTSTEAQVAAAKMIRAVSQGGANDHVRSKIFSTEGVVPVLWKQLALVLKSESLVGDLLTGALRNLSSSTEGFLQETVQARGVDILIELLRVSRPVAQSNACSLLAYVVTNDAAFCSEILDAGIVTQLLRLLGSGHDLSVRAEAAGVLKSLSAQSGNARKEITSSNGIPSLINSTIAPSKEHMQGEAAQALQENAMCALANISGGLSRVISSLTQSLTMLDSPSSSSSSSSAAQASDTLGALASALMIYDVNAQEVAPSDPLGVERTLIKHLNPKLPFVVKERTIEALASLYGNPILATGIPNSEAKRLLIRLITMCSSEVQVELLRFLPRLCTNEGRLWEAVNGREGVQLLISLLGLSSEQQQESSVALVRVLSEENAESNWAVTAAGGIPPLVQILETGSTKAREDSAAILSNLCTHSEDIRACVESADAAPSLLWLLKNGSSDGKDTAARTLSHLIRKSDSATISQLTNLLTSELPEFKAHVLDALRSMISVAPLKDILHEGSAANEAVGTMVRMLGSARAETQVGSASALSDIFSSRKDVRESSVAIAAMSSLMTLLPVEPKNVVAGLLRCLAAILLSVDSSREINAMGRVVLLPLIRLTGSSNPDVTEQAVCALANLFLDSGITADVSPDDVIFPATKILREGTTVHGKVLASSAVARFIRARDLNYSLIDCVGRAGTVLSLVSFLRSSDGGSASSSEALDALALLSRSEGVGAGIKPAWAVLAEFPDSITPIVSCIVNVPPPLQDKAVDILSKLSWCQPEVLGRAVCRSPGTLISIAERTVSSAEMKVKIGACALLVCALKVDFRGVMSDLTESDSLLRLIRSLVSMVGSPLEKENESIYICRRDRTSEDRNISSVINDVNICLWLLCLLANHDEQTRYTIAEAGAVDALSDKISQYFLRYNQGSGSAEHSCVWIAALLLSILYQNRRIAETVVSDKSIVVLSCMLRSEELDNRYFAAQAVASLVCSCSSDTTVVTVAGSGAATGLISLLGFADDDMRDILELSSEFSLLPHPEQDSLEKLLSVEEIRVGAASKKMVPLLVDLLRPLPDRLSAPYLALRLLIKLADGCSSNKVAMVESGAVEALTRYLSLSPQETMEEAVTHLLAILFSSPEIRQHESSFPAVRQLVAVLRLGGRGARYSASRALESLFSSDHIRNAEISRQAVQPLVEVVGTGAEREQHAAIAALVSLLSCNPSRNLAVADMDTSVVDVLARILSSDCSVDLKGDAAEFCSLIFGNPRIRLTVAAARCVEPLVSLLVCESIPAQHAIVRALDALLEDEQLAELVAAHGAVVPLVALLYGTSHALHDAAARVLVKLGKDRPSCKIDMVKAGVIDCALDILHEAPDHLASALADLLRILTNNASVARAPPAAKLVGPFFLLLSRPDLSPEGHHSVLQVLINVLENPKRRADQNITYDASVTPVLAFLDSPVPAVQQLAAELLSHLYSEDEDDQRHLQKHPSTHKIIPHLVRLLGPDNSGNALLQQRSATTLFSIAPTWPNVIAREGGVSELSRIILSDGASLLLWESAGSALASILQFSSEVYVEVPVAVLVRLLRAASETTVVGALNALLVLESDDGTSAESMAQSGAIDALVGLLGNHRCEDTASRLVEALVNNAKIRESKSARSAIVPLSQYLLDPNTQSAQPRLLATLALGDLFQNDGLARTAEALSACRALIGVLEDHPAMEEMTVVAVCALQNLVVHSRSNKRAVAEAGGVQVVLDLIGSPDPDTSLQSATLAKLLFSNHTIQEYASSETVRAVTAAIEKDLWASGNVHDEYLKALNALFGNFPRLRGSEPATLSIPHLVAALKTGSEATQEAALDALFFLRQAWSACSAQVSRAQSVAAADAIPLLQYLIQSGPPRFQEKSELLLQCLPGTLTVVVKRGNNMKQSVGNPSVYCKLILGTAAPRQTKVVSTGPNVEWDESFSWSFESPPKGQKLHISCKNKSKMARTSFGKVTIQIDRVVMLGVVAGEYTLQPESKAGPPRNLEIEFQWSNKNS